MRDSKIESTDPEKTYRRVLSASALVGTRCGTRLAKILEKSMRL
jgi:hypothetical protein